METLSILQEMVNHRGSPDVLWNFDVILNKVFKIWGAGDLRGHYADVASP